MYCFEFFLFIPVGADMTSTLLLPASGKQLYLFVFANGNQEMFI